ncbi:MAG: LytTR family DNA-binding domain-containing protein [Polynucleobacter sp.]|nr:LytTR family DNA-binding domain-containing protein [Polynucleobacter sp.]
MANRGKRKPSLPSPKQAQQEPEPIRPAGKSEPVSLADSLKLRVQYPAPWPHDRDTARLLPEDMLVSPQEIAEYWAFCTGEQLTLEQISQAQCWQFSVHKDSFYRLEHIPEAEKQDRTRSLLAWHPIICKYATFGPDSGDSWAKTWAGFCMELKAYEIQFIQVLAQGEAPQPVPEALLREIKDGLQQHLQQQQAVLQQLRQQRLPLWVQAGKQLKLLWPDEICFITSETKVGLEVFTVAGERYPSFETLSDLETRLVSEPQFMRTSRQHLVNLSRIDQVEPAGRGRNLTFKGLPADMQARVTDGYLKAFLERLKG